MRVATIVSFFAGLAIGAVVASTAWTAFSMYAIKTSTAELRRSMFLNDFVSDCTMALARKGLIEKNPTEMENVNLLTGVYHVARLWKEDPRNEHQVPYEFHRDNAMKVFGLDDPSDFSRLEIIRQASVFIDLEDDIIDDRVELVVDFLSKSDTN